MFDNGKWGFPKNEGPVRNGILVPVNKKGVVEPITDGKEFWRVYSFINEEIFLGSLIPEKIGIGLNNISFDEKTKRFTIHVQDKVNFPEDNKPNGEKSVNFVVKLDNLDKPKYKEISLYAEQDVNRFWDSISNVLKHWFPSIDNGLPDEAARENLINDIQRRSMTSLLDQIVMPRLKKYRRESLASLENSWNNSGLLPKQPRQLGIHTPLLYQEVILLPNKRSGSGVSSIRLPARDYPSQDSPELN
jgi:hypothetical protein